MKTLSIASLMFLLVLFSSCSEGDRISSRISHQLGYGGAVDLALVGPDEWDRVCILGPYSGNKNTQDVLGFPWDAEGNTGIHMNDGINVLVFSAGNRVVAYTGHPRSAGDFSRLASTCAHRGDAKLARKPGLWELAWEANRS